MNDAPALHADDTLLPFLEVVFVADQECKEHGGIHFADVEAAEAARVAASYFLGRVRGRVFAVGQMGAGVMRVEVEEVVALGADEVVGR